MRYYSTNDHGTLTDVRTAVLRGLAPDRGLYMPATLPPLGEAFWSWLPGRSMGDIGARFLAHFFSPEISADELARMTAEAFNFPVPVVPVADRVNALELHHGPTLAFKDVGARFLARVLGSFAKSDGRPVNVLVATSGDTGSAVANGFLDVPNVFVHILYPSGKVSPLQEKQLTTLGHNISAYEVRGVFDDCQRMVKEAFQDSAWRDKYVMTSANSINLARFLPQAVYYLHALSQLPPDQWRRLVVCVPSGNFGDLTAGLVAYKMGMPVKRFIAAVNANRPFYDYLQTGHYQPRATIATLANAMDVGDPSNFARIVDLFGGDLQSIRQAISARSYSDGDIEQALRQAFEQGYLCDPHGATGYAALRDDLRDGEIGLFFETAHPAKFIDTVQRATAHPVQMPQRLAQYAQREKHATLIDADYHNLTLK